MRPMLLLSLGAALSLAAPAPSVPHHGLQVDDSDLLKVRQEQNFKIDDSDLMKVRHVSAESEQEQAERSSHGGCLWMKFFHAAPRYISKSLSRIETVGANSRLLPVFWFHRKGGEEDGQAPATSLETTDVNESKHGGEMLYLADGEHQPWGRHHRHHRHHRHRHSRAHPILHTVMVWAHIISFLFLISFTVIYLITFVLRKTCDDSKESQEEEEERVLISEKQALVLIDEV